jgi:aminomethyltransferase
MEALKTTPLISEHRQLKAQLAPFGGWLMPIQYAGILAEHRWCRESVAVFDTCHMGELFFKGDIAATGIEELFSFRIDTVPVGRCRYGFLMNEAGGIVDDLTVYRLADDQLMFVVNAGPTEKDFLTIRERLEGSPVFDDRTGLTGKVDIQGPASRALLTELICREIENIPFFGFRSLPVLGSNAIVSRTGYTGELGYEIYMENDKVVELWNLLLADDRVKPAGLGARDLLRLELGYSLYGSDLDETITPLEAGLDRFVDFNKEFVGREALASQRYQGPKKLKAAFRVSSRRAPRHGYEIFRNGVCVGTVTSGAFSPMLGCGIGIGYVPPESVLVGTQLEIRHGDVSLEATVVELPFYRDGSLKN